MDSEETKVADDIGRYAVKAVQKMVNERGYEPENLRQKVESLSVTLREEKGHHDRRERELRDKIRDLRAEVHEWKERCLEALEYRGPQAWSALHRK